SRTGSTSRPAARIRGARCSGASSAPGARCARCGGCRRRYRADARVTLNHVRRGSGETLVLVHGLGSRWQAWNPQLDRLARERDVVALDLPGFGDSPPLAGDESPTVGRLTAAVSELMNELGL